MHSGRRYVARNFIWGTPAASIADLVLDESFPWKADGAPAA
jgi:hypothetical protein